MTAKRMFAGMKLILLSLISQSIQGLVMVQPHEKVFHHMVSNFGDRYPVEAHVVTAAQADMYGCHGIQPRFNNSIALIRRGDCRFTEKVYHAQNSGAVAAIVFNNGTEQHQFSSLNLVQMAHTEGDESEFISIPSIFVSEETGKFLWGLVANAENHAYQQRNISFPWALGPNATDPLSPFPVLRINKTGEITSVEDGAEAAIMGHLKVFLDLFLVAWGIVGVFVSLGWCRECATRYQAVSVLRELNLQRYRKPADPAAARGHCEPEEPQGPSASAAESPMGIGVGGASRVATGEYHGHAGCDSCVVCLSEFEDDELVVVLPCRHPYHQGCIEPWLVKCMQCPMCKQSVWDDPEETEEGEQELPIHIVFMTLAGALWALLSDWLVSLNLFGTQSEAEQSAAQSLVTHQRRVDAGKSLAAVLLGVIASVILVNSMP